LFVVGVFVLGGGGVWGFLGGGERLDLSTKRDGVPTKAPAEGPKIETSKSKRKKKTYVA